MLYKKQESDFVGLVAKLQNGRHILFRAILLDKVKLAQAVGITQDACIFRRRCRADVEHLNSTIYLIIA